MNSPKKILLLTLYTFGLTGGIEKVCRSMAKALSDSGRTFFLYALHDKPVDLDKRYITSSRYSAFSGSKLFALAAILKSLRSDTIILSHINLLLFGRIIKTLNPSCRVIMLAHGIEVWQELPEWKKKFLQQKTEIWAVSRYTASTLTEMHSIPNSNIKILNNCLDPFFEIPGSFGKPENLLKRYSLNDRQPVLFTLTRLSSKEAYKGYDRVLMAMEMLKGKFSDLHYIIGGKADEQEQQRITALVEELGLTDKVTLAGFIADNELSAHYRLGDIFIMPSTCEGFGIAFIEAAACGAKIIGGNKDGSIDALLNGRLGTLIDPENVQEIADAIENQLNNSEKPKEIQELCLTNFSYALYCQRIQDMLNNVPLSQSA